MGTKNQAIKTESPEQVLFKIREAMGNVSLQEMSFDLRASIQQLSDIRSGKNDNPQLKTIMKIYNYLKEKRFLK